jgi:sensor histidine kinase YesM
MRLKNLALNAFPGMMISSSRTIETKAHMLERKNAYWFSQLIGWLLFALINIVVIALFDMFTLPGAALLLFLSSVGAALTHVFRAVIKKYRWLNLSLKSLIPRVVLGSIILGSLVYGSYFLAAYFAQAYTPEKLTLGNLLTGMLNMSSVVLLWSLIYFAVHYFENYKKAEIETLIWENAVKEFELRTLKSQLNPHFMFNAMNSIRALIKEDPQSAQTALTKLSNILRYTLKIERNETVPLDEEIETVSDYLALEMIRFEERLRYKIEIDPSTGNIEIPPMMVQTLVENGIKHGISKMTYGGEISIKSFRQNGNLHIRISNSGVFDPEAIKHSSGFGIQNTKHRLSLLYGEKGSFTINNENNNTVTAEVVIPSGG